MATSKKTRTATKTKPITDIPATGERDRLPTAPPASSSSSKSVDVPDLNRATKSQTLRATSGITASDQMRSTLDRLRSLDIEPDADDTGYATTGNDREIITVTPQELPAHIGRALKRSGVQNPDWHIVKNLPGNMSTAIRTLGRRLFRQFTDTPTDDIVMIADVQGRGPNTEAELRAVVGWLKNNAEKLSDGEIDFNQFMPGYHGNYIQYRADGTRFLVVKDGMNDETFGYYVYTWPDDASLMESYRGQRFSVIL